MARRFNGTSDLINTGVVISPGSNLTMSGWFYPTALPGSYAGLMGTVGTQIFLYLTASGGLALYSSGSSYDPGSHTLSLNTWYHLLAQAGPATPLSGYVNAAVDGNTGVNVTFATADTFQLGTDPLNAGRFFQGRIADFAIYNVILTAGEIKSLSSGARPPTIRPQALFGYWPLDGLKSPEPDLSGKASNGVLTGTALATGPPVTLLTPRSPITAPAIVTFPLIVQDSAGISIFRIRDPGWNW